MTRRSAITPARSESSPAQVEHEFTDAEYSIHPIKISNSIYIGAIIYTKGCDPEASQLMRSKLLAAVDAICPQVDQ
jgi:hypothetical protein